MHVASQFYRIIKTCEVNNVRPQTRTTKGVRKKQRRINRTTAEPKEPRGNDRIDPPKGFQERKGPIRRSNEAVESIKEMRNAGVLIFSAPLQPHQHN